MPRTTPVRHVPPSANHTLNPRSRNKSLNTSETSPASHTSCHSVRHPLFSSKVGHLTLSRTPPPPPPFEDIGRHRGHRIPVGFPNLRRRNVPNLFVAAIYRTPARGTSRVHRQRLEYRQRGEAFDRTHLWGQTMLSEAPKKTPLSRLSCDEKARQQILRCEKPIC